MIEFDWPIRVYYEDTDAGGVVYHAQYLNFMERARTEWLRSLGFEQDALIEQHQCLFAVHSMQIEFKRPARLNDALSVKSVLASASGATLLFEQTVFCDGELLCQAKVKVACLNATRFRPMPIPAFMLKELKGEC